MVKENFKQIDLLRKRRGSDNLADPYFIDTNKYIKKGIFSGLILIIISLTLGIPFIFRINFLENKKDKLKPITQEYDLLVENLDKESKQLKQIAKFNKVSEEQILITSGIDGSIKNLLSLITKPKDIIAVLSPTYAMYQVYSNIFKCTYLFKYIYI